MNEITVGPWSFDPDTPVNHGYDPGKRIVARWWGNNAEYDDGRYYTSHDTLEELEHIIQQNLEQQAEECISGAFDTVTKQGYNFRCEIRATVTNYLVDAGRL